MAPVPDDVRRFLLTSIPSVPYLEAALLLRSAGDAGLAEEQVASALYVAPRTAQALLKELAEAGLVRLEPGRAAYSPRDPALAEALDRLAEVYPANLVAIATLIHDATAKSAARFAQAFRLRKDP